MADSNELIKNKTRIFNLSASSYSINYSGTLLSDGLFIIPNFIKQGGNVDHTYVSVTHAEVPNSFYLINQYNNALNINNINYFIPPGNYNVRTLIDALLIILPSTFDLTFSQVYQKIIVLNTAPFTIYYDLSTINRVMGLSRTENMIGLFAIDIYAVQLPNVVNFLPTARLNFRCDSLHLENFHINDGSSDVLLSLQNNAVPNGVITYTNNDALKFHIDLEMVNELHIRLTDDSNRLLDMNGISWFITLRVDYEYKIQIEKNSFSNIIKLNNDLNYKNLPDDITDNTNDTDNKFINK